jgi:uncharacterized protein YjbI with pentapeptide repeats
MACRSAAVCGYALPGALLLEQYHTHIQGELAAAHARNFNNFFRARGDILMSDAEIKDIVRLHATWLRNSRGRRANFRAADFRGVDFSGANLRMGVFRWCDLRACELRACDLRDANLSGCDLRGADLRGCDLRDADLRRCDLRGCDLRSVDFSGADLQGAVASGTTMEDADLSGELVEQKERWRHDSEDLTALHRNLDDVGVPRYENGAELTAWGRVERYARAKEI